MLIPNSLFCGPYYDKAFDAMNKVIAEYPDILLFTHGGDVSSYFVLKSDLPEEVMSKLQEIDRASEEEWRDSGL